MIFDPELAAAARRHVRAQAKAQKQQQAQQGSSAVDRVTSTDNLQDRLPTTVDEEGSDAAPSSGERSDNGINRVRGGDKAGSTGSTTGNNTAVADGSSWAQTVSAGNSNGDVDGVERMGPVAPKPRVMKPRVLLKIIVLGSTNVGKTSLMKRYAANDFSEKRRPTIGADFMTKEFIAGDQPMLLQVWDTAGQERFHGGALGSGFFRGANAALLVYDVSNASSFEQVAMWREELLVRLDVDPHDFPIVVIGNKVDLAKDLPMDGIHGVDMSRVLKWCNMQHMGHIETSAKDGTGVEAAMQAVAMSALDQKRKRERELELNPSLGGSSLDLAMRREKQQNARACC